MIDKPIFSEHWYRVKDLRPQLRPHIKLHRHECRGDVWYLLQDHSSGRYHRFNASAYQVIGLMDGQRTVEEIWLQVNTLLGDDAPVQDDTISLLGQIHNVDALQTEIPPDVAELVQRGEGYEEEKRKARIKNPLSLRLPLFDPDRFLTRTLSLVKGFFSWQFFIAWLLLLVTAALLAGVNGPALIDAGAYHALDTRNLVLLWFVYPIVKLLHELGHAYAAKLEGGEVHEMGIIFLVFIPIPYVDASAATTFGDRRKRMLVGAAGIMVELFLAAVALLFWLNIEPGITRSVCLSIILIGGLSTVFFNGNPLLRFDGYYILADAIDIPNLAKRSNLYLAYLIQHYVFGMEQARSPVTARGESKWFVFYSIAAFSYRLLVLSVICLFLLDKLFVVGVMLALWIVFNQLLVPLMRQVGFVLVNPVLQRQRTRAVLATTLALTVVGVGFFLVPVKSLTLFEGVVKPPDESQLVAQADGFIEQVLAQPGSAVTVGQPLLRLKNSEYEGEMAVNEARLRELSARLNAAQVHDQVEASLVRDEMGTLEAQLDRTRGKLESMLFTSPIDGFFILPDAVDLPGRYVGKGDVLGYVMNTEFAAARVVVTQDDLNRISEQIEDIELRLASRIDEVVRGRLIREVPQATNQLPSKVLSVDGGGKFMPDPIGQFPLSTRERLFEFEIELPLSNAAAMIGTRVYVRFDHGAETLSTQTQRRLRQLFLRRLNN